MSPPLLFLCYCFSLLEGWKFKHFRLITSLLKTISLSHKSPMLILSFSVIVMLAHRLILLCLLLISVVLDCVCLWLVIISGCQTNPRLKSNGPSSISWNCENKLSITWREVNSSTYNRWLILRRWWLWSGHLSATITTKAFRLALLSFFMFSSSLPLDDLLRRSLKFMVFSFNVLILWVYLIRFRIVICSILE